MSELVVQVTTVDAVTPHPNADRLALCQIQGWQCVVAKDTHHAGQRVVFFPPDTILPPAVSDRFGVTQYLHKGRITHTRLRGEPSFGLAVLPDEDWPVGTDVAAHYGATKYEPPVRGYSGTPGAPRLPEHPKFFTYTDIANLRHYPALLSEGEEVIVSEKIDGTNARAAVIDGRIMAGSRRLSRGKPKAGHTWDTSEDATYWLPYFGYAGVERLLQGFLIPQNFWQRLLRRPRRSTHDVILFGEVYGPSIQSFDYGLGAGSLEFRAFDLMIDGVYLNWKDFLACCRAHAIPTVPCLYQGPYDLDLVRFLASGASELGGSHLREGVVVRPVAERSDPRLGRVILKYVSDDYLLLKQKTDYTEA